MEWLIWITAGDVLRHDSAKWLGHHGFCNDLGFHWDLVGHKIIPAIYIQFSTKFHKGPFTNADILHISIKNRFGLYTTCVCGIRRNHVLLGIHHPHIYFHILYTFYCWCFLLVFCTFLCIKVVDERYPCTVYIRMLDGFVLGY